MRGEGGAAGSDADDGSEQQSAHDLRVPIDMLVDPMGLGYTARAGRISVYYPVHDSARAGGSRYGTGFEIGPIPESYWTEPPNEITRLRAAIWRTLLAQLSV